MASGMCRWSEYVCACVCFHLCLTISAASLLTDVTLPPDLLLTPRIDPRSHMPTIIVVIFYIKFDSPRAAVNDCLSCCVW